MNNQSGTEELSSLFLLEILDISDQIFNFPCFKFNWRPSRAYHYNLWLVRLTVARVSNFNCRTSNSARMNAMNLCMLNVHLTKASKVNKMWVLFMSDNVEKSLASFNQITTSRHDCFFYFVSTKSKAARTSYRSFITASTTAIKAFAVCFVNKLENLLKFFNFKNEQRLKLLKCINWMKRWKWSVNGKSMTLKGGKMKGNCRGNDRADNEWETGEKWRKILRARRENLI